MIAVFSQVVSLASTWIEGQTEKTRSKIAKEVALKEAEAEVIRRKATSEIDWDLEALQGSQNSWADEYLTIILSIPLILCFIPQLEGVVAHGFDQLQNVPDWYKAAFGVVVSASFGVRNFSKFFKK